MAIIDEFPYLIRSNPGLPSLLQRALDDQAWELQRALDAEPIVLPTWDPMRALPLAR